MGEIMTETATGLFAARQAQAKRSWRAKRDAALYVTVGLGTCGLAAGAGESLAATEAELARRNLLAVIGCVGCVGMCAYEPMIELHSPVHGRFNYGQAAAENIPEIFAAYFDGAPLRNAVVIGEVVPAAAEVSGRALESLSFTDPEAHVRIPFQGKQLRVVLSNCGLIDPESIDDYLALDGYVALKKALHSMTPEEVIEEMIRSGLRGRGGGGFSTGQKWRLARQTPRWPKYVICNADEGDPGSWIARRWRGIRTRSSKG
jgi:NADH-quinone oxidoreductase subunit F